MIFFKFFPETKKTLVRFVLFILSKNCFIFVFCFGTKPKKAKLWIGSPDNCKAFITEDAPGIAVIK